MDEIAAIPSPLLVVLIVDFIRLKIRIATQYLICFLQILKLIQFFRCQVYFLHEIIFLNYTGLQFLSTNDSHLGTLLLQLFLSSQLLINTLGLSKLVHSLLLAMAIKPLFFEAVSHLLTDLLLLDCLLFLLLLPLITQSIQYMLLDLLFLRLFYYLFNMRFIKAGFDNSRGVFLALQGIDLIVFSFFFNPVIMILNVEILQIL